MSSLLLLATVIGASPTTAEIASAHHGLAASIQSLSGRVTFVMPTAKYDNYCKEITFLVKGDRARSVEKLPAETNTYFFSPDRRYLLFERVRGSKTLVGANVRRRSDEPERTDPWELTLFRVNNRAIADWVSSGEVRSVATRSTTGEPVVEVSIHIDKGAMSLWFDTLRGYAVRRVSQEFDNGFVVRHEVGSWCEPAPGIDFPAQITMSRRDVGSTGDPALLRVATFHDLKINGAVKDSDLTPRFPMNCPMNDDITGTFYRVDDFGRRISAQSFLPPPRGNARPPLDTPSTSPTAKANEKTGDYRWVCIGLASMLLVFVGLWHRRRASAGS